MADIENHTAQQLRSYIERIERLEEEKANLAADIKDIFAEAKGNGFDVKTMREVLKIRKQDASDRDEQQALLSLYMNALGMLADTPLGEAAVDRLKASDTREVRKAVEKLVPKGGGSVEITTGGKGVKLSRDTDGRIQSEAVGNA